MKQKKHFWCASLCLPSTGPQSWQLLQPAVEAGPSRNLKAFLFLVVKTPFRDKKFGFVRFICVYIPHKKTKKTNKKKPVASCSTLLRKRSIYSYSKL